MTGALQLCIHRGKSLSTRPIVLRSPYNGKHLNVHTQHVSRTAKFRTSI